MAQCGVVLCFREELCSFQREIEVLSEQYSQKCLENAHLAQALEAERQALRQCQRENQELNAHNQVQTHTCEQIFTESHSLHEYTVSGCSAKFCFFVAFVGAQQPFGSRDHQDALHDI